MKKFEHYWMCFECATEMGGTFPEGHCCTVCLDTCPYCGKENVTVVPYVDFDWTDLDTEHLRD